MLWKFNFRFYNIKTLKNLFFSGYTKGREGKRKMTWKNPIPEKALCGTGRSLKMHTRTC
jgi:hypothetical protein